jgi:hypothetical protein
MWTWKPHYYSSTLPFYNFPYTFGLLFATGLYAIYRSRGPEFVEDYKKLLASTGEADAAALARRFGIDIRTRRSGMTVWRSSAGRSIVSAKSTRAEPAPTTMQPTVTRWRDAALPTEESLRQQSAEASTYAGENGTINAGHSHDFDKLIYVVRSITPDPAQGAITLHAGDRLMPAAHVRPPWELGRSAMKPTHRL